MSTQSEPAYEQQESPPSDCTQPSMPLCTLHLVQLQASGDVKAHFLRQLLASPLGPRILVASVVRRAVIVANRIDPLPLNSTPWDLLLVVGPDAGAKGDNVPAPLSLLRHPLTHSDVSAEYVVDVGIPSRILEAYPERTRTLNQQAAASKTEKTNLQSLLASPARAHPGYAPRTSQLLEMSDDLAHLIDELDVLGDDDGLVSPSGPVHQLNLLSFKKSDEDKERYYQYGKRFAGVASQYGGEAKLLGLVVENEGRKRAAQWDEVSLVSYHSLRHFAAMAASEEYQDINRAYRLPSLDDTSIICTQEVDLDRLRTQAKARM